MSLLDRLRIFVTEDEEDFDNNVVLGDLRTPTPTEILAAAHDLGYGTIPMVKCETCNGSSESDECWHDVSLIERCYEPHPCPNNCLNGLVPSPEAIEAFRNGLRTAIGQSVWDYEQLDDIDAIARAGLLAATGTEEQ